VLEYLLFAAYFSVNVTPYHPVAFDQLVTYNVVYDAYFSLRRDGLTSAPAAIAGIQARAFKGWVVPTLGLISTVVFGPHRSSVALVNFAFFVCGQLAVWGFVRAWHGPAAGMLAWGLFLLSGTHYFWAGGLDDLRVDYAGMVVFGVGFLLLVSFVREPSATRFWTCLLAFAAALSTRSITMVYFLGTLALLLLLFSLQYAWGRRDEGHRRRVRLLSLLFAGVLLEVGVFGLLHWRRFAGYYLGLKFGPEDSIRKAEMGASTLRDMLLYYPKSALSHFSPYLVVGAVFACYFLLKWVRFRTLTGSAPKPRGTGSFWPVLTVFGATALAVYAPLTLYSPSPVVIGVLTIPIVAVLATTLAEGFEWLKPAIGRKTVAVAVAAAGLANYADAMVRPRFLAAVARVEAAAAVNRCFQDLERIARASGESLVVYWMLVHPGFHPLALNVYLYEHGAEALVAKFRPARGRIFQATEAELLENLRRADVAVAYSEMPLGRGFEYPFVQSLRRLEPVWRGYLAREFVRVRSYDIGVGRGSLGLYVRPGMGAASSLRYTSVDPALRVSSA